MVNDFRPFKNAMAKLSTASRTIEADDGQTAEIVKAIDSKRRIDTSYEIYLSLYQAITGPEDRQKLFREFSPGFFDLIVVDECHRGSADEDAAWREILEYFSVSNADRHDGNAERDEVRLKYSLLWPARLHLLPEARYSGWISRSVQGDQRPH